MSTIGKYNELGQKVTGYGIKGHIVTDCDYWHHMDKQYDTPDDSPLHHDSRCEDCRISTKHYLPSYREDASNAMLVGIMAAHNEGRDPAWTIDLDATNFDWPMCGDMLTKHRRQMADSRAIKETR